MPGPAADVDDPQLLNYKPLQGLSIAVTAIDLEQREHRGIAYFSKALLQALDGLGADVYLLTAMRGRRLSAWSMRRMAPAAALSVVSADIVDQLMDPPLRFGPALGQQGLRACWRQLRKLLWAVRLLIGFGIKGGRVGGVASVPLHDFEASPYRGVERLDYLQWVRGFLSVPVLYALVEMRSRRWLPWPPRVQLEDHNIGLLISTCPLSLAAVNQMGQALPMLQVIHDAFPLEYARHPDQPFYFHNRLHDALSHGCVFVSSAARSRVLRLLGRSDDLLNPALLRRVVVQSPSLRVPALKAALSVPALRGVDGPFVLFNSSVVPRKNLLFLLEAFRSSGLTERGVKLVIAGALHDDDYSHMIRSHCEHDPAVCLWGYVDELEKAWLYLRTSAVTSPSLCEGFGIPVLDAACLGVPVLASAIPSHRDIAALFEADPKPVRLLALHDVEAWTLAFQDLAPLAVVPDSQAVQCRYQTYLVAQQRLQATFAAGLADAIAATLAERGSAG